MRTETANPIDSSPQNRFLVLLVISLLIAGTAVSAKTSLNGGTFKLWALLLVLPWAIRFGALHTVSLVLIFLASYLVARLSPDSTPQLLEKASGIIAFLYFAFLLAPLRRTLDWVRPGKLNLSSAILAIAIVALSALGLIGWAHFAHLDKDFYAKTLPNLSPRLLVVYMGVFAIINALIEEIIWRGVMMSALDLAFGAGIFTLVVQAISFGLAHYLHGFPNGWIGSLLAGLFGLGMGLLRRISNGMLVPWCVHAAADLTVICLIVHFAHHG